MLTRAREATPPEQAVPAADIVREALQRLELRIAESGARVEVDPDLPSIRADRTWATQAVYNLLHNAIKFCADGLPAEVEVRPYRNGGQGDVVGIVVRDRGCGVPQEERERIFGLFQRAVGRDIEGTGAGLAIVREVARRHGGDAWVEARPGGGSDFYLTFAGHPAPPRAPEQAGPA
jgi:signal transduction histidine kinase